MTVLGGTAGVVLGISQAVYLVAMATLGVRLLLLTHRTRELPELLLAVHFLLCCTLGYALQGGGHALALAPGASRALFAALLVIGHGASTIGVAAVLWFNYHVFRRGTILGRALLACGLLVLVTGYVGYLASGGPGDGLPRGFWFWWLYAGYTGASIWTLAEPLRFFVVLRRRRRLGLADPVLVDRFLLWGLGSVARFTMLAVGAVSILLLGGSVSTLAAAAGPTFVATSVAGLCVAGAYWLAFFAPAAYQRAVTRRA
jgi:hypothetical protein